MPDLNALAVFGQVADAHSFSEASRRMNMPVSTVSRKVAELEADLGARLFERSTRQLRLTDLGRDVLGHAKQIADVNDAILATVSNQMAEVKGTLRLSAPPSVADSLLVPIITAFNASYPDVYVHVMITDRMVDHISEGVDLALRVGPLKDSALVARKLMTYRHRLLASRAYLETHGTPQVPDDLHAHRLIAFSFWNDENTWTLTKGNEIRKTGFRPHLAMNDYAGLARAIADGTGIGELPPIVCTDLQRSAELMDVLEGWKFREVTLSLVHLGARHMPRHVRLFADFAQQSCKSRVRPTKARADRT